MYIYTAVYVIVISNYHYQDNYISWLGTCQYLGKNIIAVDNYRE